MAIVSGTPFDQVLLQIGQAYNSVLSEQTRLQQDRTQFEAQLKLQMANLKAREEGLQIEQQNLALRKQSQEFDQLLDFMKFKHNVDIDRETLQLKKAEAGAPGKTLSVAAQAAEERKYKDLMVRSKEEITATETDSDPEFRGILSIEKLQDHLNGIRTERNRLVTAGMHLDPNSLLPTRESLQIDQRLSRAEAELQRRTKALTTFYGTSPDQIMESTRRSLGETETAIPESAEVSPLSNVVRSFLDTGAPEARQTLKQAFTEATFADEATRTNFFGTLFNALPEGQRTEEQLQKFIDALK